MDSTTAVSRDTATRRARLDHLKQLVEGLSYDDRRDMLSMILEKNDQVMALPIELIHQIFSYLPILDAWRLQLVTRKWRRVLSSDMILKDTIARWETHDPSDCVLPPSTQEEDYVKDRVRHMQAMRLGRPFSRVEYSDTLAAWRRGQEGRGLRAHQLKGHFLAYIRLVQDDGDEVVVRDLLSGGVLVLRDPAHGKVAGLTLTESIVAFVNYSGRLCVKELSPSSTEMITIRIPSFNTYDLVGDGNAVALLMDEADPGTKVVATWSLETPRLRALAFDVQKVRLGKEDIALAPSRLILDHRSQILDVFSGNPGHNISERSFTSPKILPDEIFYIGHMRFAMDGSHTFKFMCESQIPVPDYIYECALGDIVSVGHRGLFKIRVDSVLNLATATPGSFGPLHRDMSVYFDQPRCLMFREPADPQDGSVLAEQVHQRHPEIHFVPWKDVCYASKPNPSYLSTLTSPNNTLPRTAIAHQSLFPSPHGEPYRSWDEDSTCRERLLVNDTFLVMLKPHHNVNSPHRIRVFCFEERVTPFDAVETGLWDESSEASSDDVFPVNTRIVEPY